MKYRILTNNELGLLEDDFHIFLDEEGIGAKEWKDYHKDSPEDAKQLLAKFSDQIFLKVLEDVEYLEHRSAKSLRLFECRKDKMVMIGLDVDKNSKMDFTEPSTFQNRPKNISGLKSFHLEKEYDLLREDEIYHLMECGCYVVNAEVFNQMTIYRKMLQN